MMLMLIVVYPDGRHTFDDVFSPYLGVDGVILSNDLFSLVSLRV